jgi:5'-nucleotidase
MGWGEPVFHPRSEHSTGVSPSLPPVEPLDFDGRACGVWSTASNTHSDRIAMSDGLIVLVDQDGPLADFDAAFYAMCRDYDIDMHGVIPHPDFRCEVHRFATDCIADSNLRHQARTHVDTVPWFRDLPVVPGAVDGINALAAHPAVSDVFICTKPLESNTSCRDDKAAWVRRHLGGDWERRLILAPDKSMVRGHILLDDAPKPQWFKFAEWTPVVYPTSWNSPGGVFSTKAEVNDAPRWQWGDPVESLLEAVLP